MVQSEKLEKCLLSTIIVLFFINIFLNILFSFLYTTYELENNTIISEIENSLNGKLITSFEIKFSCNLLLNEEILVLGKWPGTSEGCDCDGLITRKTCSDEEEKKGCKKINENSPINYEKINGNLICIKRTENSYKELLKLNKIIEKNKDCLENQKYCGIIDTLGNKLCVDNNEDCPLKIKDINSKFKLFLKRQLLEENYIYSNDNDDKLLFTLKLNQYYPCINPSEYYWNYYTKLEPDNQRCTTEIKGKLKDERYELINEYNSTVLKLYEDNSISKFIVIDDILRDKLEREQVYLFGRNILGFNLENLEKSGFSYEKIISFQKKSNICNLILKIISFIIILFIVIPFKVGYDKFSEKKENYSDAEYETCLKVCLIISLIFCVIIFVFGFILWSIICNEARKIKNNLNLEIGDEYTMELLPNLYEKYSKNLSFSIAIMVYDIFILILIISFIIYLKCF